MGAAARSRAPAAESGSNRDSGFIQGVSHCFQSRKTGNRLDPEEKPAAQGIRKPTWPTGSEANRHRKTGENHNAGGKTNKIKADHSGQRLKVRSQSVEEKGGGASNLFFMIQEVSPGQLPLDQWFWFWSSVCQWFSQGNQVIQSTYQLTFSRLLIGRYDTRIKAIKQVKLKTRTLSSSSGLTPDTSIRYWSDTKPRCSAPFLFTHTVLASGE